MSILTNPADGAKDGAAAYVTAVLDLVGSQDPMDVLRETPAHVAALVADLEQSRLRRPEREGKWSMAQVVQHLADSELVWGYRVRRIMAEDRPTITGFDQDRWADGLRYADADVDSALAMFTSLRQANMALLDAASGQDMDRVGVHAERGEESLRHMVRLYAGHDLAHRRQLARLRDLAPEPGEA